MTWLRTVAQEAAFALLGVCIAAAIYAALRVYQRRTLDGFGDVDLVFADDSAMLAQLHVVGHVGTCRTFFLIDTGFSGPLVVNETVLAAAATSGREWDALTYRDMVQYVDDHGDLDSSDARSLAAHYGVRISGTATRTLQALGSTETREVVQGTAALALGEGTGQDIDIVTEYVPHTGCILTIDVLVRMRPAVMDFVQSQFRTVATVPPGAWAPRQTFDDVIFLTVRVAGRECRLIMDTGYGGCIALNGDVAAAIHRNAPCAVTEDTVTQFDVNSNQVCAAVMRLPCELLTAAGDAVSMGLDLPVYANQTSVDGDGLIGLELLRRLSFLVIDASTLRTPRALLGPPIDLDWCDAHHAVTTLASCTKPPLSPDPSCPPATDACRISRV